MKRQELVVITLVGGLVVILWYFKLYNKSLPVNSGDLSLRKYEFFDEVYDKYGWNCIEKIASGWIKGIVKQLKICICVKNQMQSEDSTSNLQVLSLVWNDDVQI